MGGGSDLLIHDWSVSAGAWRFGVCEWDPSIIELSENVAHGENVTKPMQRTEVLLGSTSFGTSFSADQVLGLGVIGAVLLVAVVSFVITKSRRSGNLPAL